MKKLFERWFCKHKWKEFDRVWVFEKDYDKMPTKTKVTLICEDCGKIKKINL